jgi:iron complex transport system substrate-binding protein
MRICSLLPSITETLFELGLGESVVAVTHECDWPPEARTKPAVTRSRIQLEGHSSADVDQQVRDHSGALYDLDTDALARLRPDLILTQSLCAVCAVDETAVRDAAASLPGAPTVASFAPTCLAGVMAMIDEIGRLTGTPAAAKQLRIRFTGGIDRVNVSRGAQVHSPRVVCLEWTDPPFTCGHWTPELVQIAGGIELLGREGQPSRRASWEEVAAADSDVLLIAPCGFSLLRTLKDLPTLDRKPAWPKLRAVREGRVFAADGSAYFNRPGPRLIESLHILAEVLHPDRFPGLAPANSFQRILPAGRMNG